MGKQIKDFVRYRPQEAEVSRYRVEFSGRKKGAIGAWGPCAVAFRSSARLSNAEVIRLASIDAAHQFGFEVNHITGIEEVEE